MRPADLAAELADAKNYPDVRVMSVNLNQSDTPLPDLDMLMQPWTAASEQGKSSNYLFSVYWLLWNERNPKNIGNRLF